MREILLWGGEIRGKSENILQYIVTNILYWLLQQYQYIVLVATCIAIYCIGGNEYCNIFIVRIRNHQYNNNTIVRIPVSKCYTPQSVALGRCLSQTNRVHKREIS